MTASEFAVVYLHDGETLYSCVGLLYSCFFLDAASFWRLEDTDGVGRTHFNGFSISVTAVPEPSALAIVALASLGLIVRRRKS